MNRHEIFAAARAGLWVLREPAGAAGVQEQQTCGRSAARSPLCRNCTGTAAGRGSAKFAAVSGTAAAAAVTGTTATAGADTGTAATAGAVTGTAAAAAAGRSIAGETAAKAAPAGTARRGIFAVLRRAVLLVFAGAGLCLGLAACTGDEVPEVEVSSVRDPVVFDVKLVVLNQADRDFLNSYSQQVSGKGAGAPAKKDPAKKDKEESEKESGAGASRPPEPESLSAGLQRARAGQGEQAAQLRMLLQSALDDQSALKGNIEKHLNAMPKISAKRVHLFKGRIENEIRTALQALGYYHPVIYVLPDRPARSEANQGAAAADGKQQSGGAAREAAADEGEQTVQVLVDPGPPVIVRDLNIMVLGEGENCASFGEILKASKLQKYAVLDHSAYESLKGALLQKAKDLGFFDAEFSSSQILVYKDQNLADIELILNTGRRYHFGALVALDRDREEKLLLPAKVFARRHLAEGSPFDTAKIGEFQSDMNATNYYRSVDVTPLVENRNEQDLSVPLEINLEPNKNHLFRVGVGYDTDEGARFLFQWDMPRLNDRGDSLSTFARVSQVSLDAHVIYKIPVRDPNRDYNYIKVGQTYTDLNDTISNLSHVSYHWVSEVCNWRWDASIRYEFEDYTQGSEKGVSTNLMPGLNLSRTGTEGEKYDPSWGYSINVDLSAGTAMLTDNNFGRILATYKQILSPSERTRFIFKMQQGVVTGQDALMVPPSLRFFVGGDQSVRGYGYKDESVRNSGGLKGGRYLTTASGEFQFPIGIPSARLAMFMDAGTACDDYKDSDIIYGPGVGFRYITPYGTVRADIAYGLQRDSGIEFHFFFGPEF